MWDPHHSRTPLEELSGRKMFELLKKTRLKCISFRPGDIMLAKVIFLGDAQSNYLLTTAENDLGVVVAHSESGVPMVPISWCEMQCPRTHTKEFLKVA
ncbi:exosome complex component CSL4-like [Dromiciops gliroides]|uniref:exosome complex component CSL4-like n=1 Tax=Dromiciops gliroides TaxID=33562 RepID=UPI001CC5B18C|nr:exosome complex component CSL4-like [Dromiciops gliroides]